MAQSAKVDWDKYPRSLDLITLLKQSCVSVKGETIVISFGHLFSLE